MASKRRRPRKQSDSDWMPWAIGAAIIIGLAISDSALIWLPLNTSAWAEIQIRTLPDLLCRLCEVNDGD